MQIAETLLKPSHLQKQEMEQIACQAVKAPATFKALLSLMESGQPELAGRAAWCFSQAAKLKPDWAKAQQADIVRVLEKPGLSDGVLRNTLRVLRDMTLDPANFDQLVFHCFNFIEDPDRPVAIRAFAMHILGQIGCHIADIRSEVKAIIEYHFENGAPGLRAAGKAVLRVWEKPAYKSK